MKVPPTTGTQRLLAIFFRHGHKSTREQADVLLFTAGLLVECFLLGALFFQFLGRATGIAWLVAFFVMLSLLFSIAVHQFLIFRNYSLHYSLSHDRFKGLERVICLLFGVLTGELGYLVILVVCNNPGWLRAPPPLSRWFFAVAVIAVCAVLLRYMLGKRQWKRLGTWFAIAALSSLALVLMIATFSDPKFLAITATNDSVSWFFAERPLHLEAHDPAVPISAGSLYAAAIEWFVHALGCALKALFALGAAVLSLMIFVWDFLTDGTVDQAPGRMEGVGITAQGGDDKKTIEKAGQTDEELISASYEGSRGFFKSMDFLASCTWLAILGVILPQGLFHNSPENWCSFLAMVGLSYGLVALLRLRKAKKTLEALSSWHVADKLVI
jgi:hypothetical protein